MKLGDELREFCDCNQGRLCCTCRQGRLPMNADLRPERLLADVEETVARINNAPEPFDRSRFWCEVAIQRGKRMNRQWTEIRSLGCRVKIYWVLALLGWAAFFIQLLRA